MTVLNNADKIMLGSSVVSRVYLGANLVWPVAQQKHAYWRVYITANGGDKYDAVQEIELRATGADQANGGTAIASDTHYLYTPAGAFDGDLITRSAAWTSDGSAGDHWIGYHFAAAVVVDVVEIWPVNRAEAAVRAPKDFSYDYSDDGVTWTTKEQFTGITGWVAGQSKVFTI